MVVCLVSSCAALLLFISSSSSIENPPLQIPCSASASICFFTFKRLWRCDKNSRKGTRIKDVDKDLGRRKSAVGQEKMEIVLLKISTSTSSAGVATSTLLHNRVAHWISKYCVASPPRHCETKLPRKVNLILSYLDGQECNEAF